MQLTLERHLKSELRISYKKNPIHQTRTTPVFVSDFEHFDHKQIYSIDDFVF